MDLQRIQHKNIDLFQIENPFQNTINIF